MSTYSMAPRPGPMPESVRQDVLNLALIEAHLDRDGYSVVTDDETGCACIVVMEPCRGDYAVAAMSPWGHFRGSGATRTDAAYDLGNNIKHAGGAL